MYKEFDTAVLKDGRIASIENEDSPGSYTGTVGNGPKTWEIVYFTDADIERHAIQDEIDADVINQNTS